MSVTGVYRFYLDGELVGEAENVVTETGKQYILRYMAGLVPTMANSIAVGASSEPAYDTDTELEFELARGDIYLRSVDYGTRDVIWKATIPVGPSGVIHEVGLFPSSKNNSSGNYQSATLFTFDTTEDWTNISETDTVNSRIYGAGIKDTITTASTSVNHVLPYYPGDLSGYSPNDIFVLGCVTYSDYVEDVVVTFTNNAGDTMVGTFVVPSHLEAPGDPQYNMIKLDKGSFTNLDKNWSGIRSVQVTVNSSSSAGGGNDGIITLDGLRVIDIDQSNENYTLISRAALRSPITKQSGLTLDIEYGLRLQI